MISVDEAFSILNAVPFLLKEQEVFLWEARYSVLAETLYAPINMPPFRQSNMDGFAIALHDALEYAIIGEIKAGDSNEIKLQPGEAVSIFTGAAVPDSANAVIQIEKISVNGTQLLLQEPVLPGANIRELGTQIQMGQPALEKGILLNPAAVGFLAGLGFTAVKVYRKPSVGIVVTGNELILPGQPLPAGKIYESNSILLRAALSEAHYDAVCCYQVDDDFESTKAILRQAIDKHDVVIVSGGISVGDYDFVGKALQHLEVEKLFYKVNQKPGKPLYVGKQKDTMVFALPGNPAATLVCFYMYVKATLERLSGMEASYALRNSKCLAHDYAVANSREQFLKAKIMDDEVTILHHQESSMLDSFAVADVLVYLPAGYYAITKGDKVAICLL